MGQGTSEWVYAAVNVTWSEGAARQEFRGGYYLISRNRFDENTIYFGETFAKIAQISSPGKAGGGSEGPRREKDSDSEYYQLLLGIIVLLLSQVECRQGIQAHSAPRPLKLFGPPSRSLRMQHGAAPQGPR